METEELERPRPVDYPAPPDGSPAGPNPRQALAHTTEAEELLYGGAASGGKTDFLIAEVLAVLFEFPGANGAIFRRTYPQLTELGGIEQRLLDRIPQPSVGTYNAGSRTWKFRNGSRLRLAYLQRDADVTKFQGAEWAIFAIDQVEQFTEFQYRYLVHRLRVSGPLAAEMSRKGYKPKAILSANPGGVGHQWVKSRFIDPFPGGEVVFRPPETEDEPHPLTRVFIPAKLADNESNVDPGVRRRLESLPGDTRRAMLEGDWNVYAGQRFRQFRTDIHVIEPEQMPISLGGVTRAMGIDYGLSAPFCALWGVKLTRPGDEDLIVVYRELYATNLTPRQQAEAILKAEASGERDRRRPIRAALDPACWARDPNRPVNAGEGTKHAPPPGSIADTYVKTGVAVERANNSRLDGAALVDELLTPPPKLLIYSTCRNLIRTLPGLPRSDRDPEDVDTDAEDHAYDALRYLLMLLAKAKGTVQADQVVARRERVRNRQVAAGVTTGLRKSGF